MLQYDTIWYDVCARKLADTCQFSVTRRNWKSVRFRDVASVLTCRSRGAEVLHLSLASDLVCLGLISVSSSERLGLGLASVWIVNASVSGFKVSISPRSRLKCLVHIPGLHWTEVKNCEYWSNNRRKNAEMEVTGGETNLRMFSGRKVGPGKEKVGGRAESWGGEKKTRVSRSEWSWQGNCRTVCGYLDVFVGKELALRPLSHMHEDISCGLGFSLPVAVMILVSKEKWSET